MMSEDSKTEETVFIVDDDPAICEGLCDLLESVGLSAKSYSSAEEFFDAMHPGMAGCLVLDVRLPRMNGLELQSKLTESGIAIPVIIMTAHGDMAMVRKALKAGAAEFLVKPFQDVELLQAIEQAFALDRVRRQRGRLVSSIEARLQSLTERERQVMKLVAAGLMNKQIADQLHLSVVTIKMHRGQVMRKMEAESLADLVRMCEKIDPTSI
jgi:FixJ family two-component response regulator